MGTHCLIFLIIGNLVFPPSFSFAGGTSVRQVTNGLGGPRFRWHHDRFVAQLFFGSNPVLNIFSVFAAASKIQLMSPASHLFSRRFSASKHGTLPCFQYEAGAPDRPPYMRCGLLAVW